MTNFGERFASWALKQEHVRALVQIGSHVRPLNQVGSADAFSDWDFQIISSAPSVLENPDEYLAAIGRPLLLSAREGRLGSAKKITLLLEEGELDIVVIPNAQLEQVLPLVASRAHLSNPQVMRALEDLAAVLAGGYSVLKGDSVISELYSFVHRSVSPHRLSNREIHAIANGFVCDFVSTQRKIQRGEYLAAQRWLHLYLVEVNFKLVHEIRQRANLVSFPDARRVESLGDEALQHALGIEAMLTASSLTLAVQKCATNFRSLVQCLLDGNWTWPPAIKLER